MSLKEIKLRFGEVRELYNEDKSAGERITLEMLAKKYNVSVATLSRVEQGITEPNITAIKAYSETFGVTPGYLLCIDESDNMKETAIIRTLGLTDATVKTLTEIKASSSKENDLSAVLNAFLGNRELTLTFFQNMLKYLRNYKGDELSIEKDILGNALFSSLAGYIHNVVKPQLRTVLEKTPNMFAHSTPLTLNIRELKTPPTWDLKRFLPETRQWKTTKRKKRKS